MSEFNRGISKALRRRRARDRAAAVATLRQRGMSFRAIAKVIVNANTGEVGISVARAEQLAKIDARERRVDVFQGLRYWSKLSIEPDEKWCGQYRSMQDAIEDMTSELVKEGSDE